MGDCMMGHTLSAALYLVALSNPISKVFLLSMLADKEETAAIREASIRASVVALALLLILAAVGNSIFTLVFHVELHSLRVAGGIVLFAIGYQALTRGGVFRDDAC
jgi:multiple antibiotic resistance protein